MIVKLTQALNSSKIIFGKLDYKHLHLSMNKTIITIGIILVIIGVMWPFLIKIPIGKLPGDIVFKKDGFSFYFPITTMIIISIVLSVIVWFFRK